MPTRRLATLAALALVATTSGCSTFSERFHVPGRDPLLVFLGAEYDTRARDWPAASVPELRAWRTEVIPDRLPPPGVPHLGWPPL
jgi:hypothetical protein